MVSYCHRCHGELQLTKGASLADDELGLFCGRCGAPQLKLADYTRVAEVQGVLGETTGTLPPPFVSDGTEVNWKVALTSSLAIAFVAAVLTLIGLRINVVGFLGTLWVLSSGVIALGLYCRRARKTQWDGRRGFRLGLVTGLLTLAGIGVVGAAAGVVMRFGTNAMASFDQEGAEQTKKTQAWMVNFLARQGQDKAAQDKYVELLNSPLMTSQEVKAGGELASLAFEGGLIVLICGGGGAFAGAMQRRQVARVSQG